MIELPRGVWEWLTTSERNLARIAGALEMIVEELTHIREVLERDDRKENQ